MPASSDYFHGGLTVLAVGSKLHSKVLEGDLALTVNKFKLSQPAKSKYAETSLMLLSLLGGGAYYSC